MSTNEPTADRVWLVWSREHNCWWRENRAGYTTSMDAAGRYTHEEAEKICRVVCRRVLPEHDTGPSEFMVVDPAAFAAAISRAERAERERDNWKSTAEDAHYRMVLARRALSVGVDVNPSDVERIDTLTRNSAGGGA